MTDKTNTAWWNLPIDELEQMADKDGKIKLSFNDTSSPLIVTEESSPDLIYVLMPMRV